MALVILAEGKVPELPNFISLLYEYFHEYEWAVFLHTWENVIFSILTATLVSGLFIWGARRRDMVPSGMQNAVELVIEFFRSLVVGILGRDGDRYVPFLGTLFIYILSMNVIGLVPLMKSPSTNLNITIGLAICVFFLVQYLNIKNRGILGLLYHMAGEPKGFLGWVMVPLLFPIELINQLARPVTLSLRLFGNITGEEILIVAFAGLGAMLMSWVGSPVGLPLQVPFMFLALLTSTMQALVFTLLSTVYILLSADHAEENSHADK
ncbi:MAG: F0F1 ATP synthase subunit A [Chlamydiales bacterium]|nr:F0F1 ATP synthase subunit A [Chlamydiales bacterium]